MSKQIHFKQFSLVSVQFQCQSVLFQVILLRNLVLFNPCIGPYKVLPLRAGVDLGVMAMKDYSAFAEAPGLLEPQHQTVLCHIRKFFAEELLLCRDAVSVFYSISRLGKQSIVFNYSNQQILTESHPIHILSFYLVDQDVQSIIWH